MRTTRLLKLVLFLLTAVLASAAQAQSPKNFHVGQWVLDDHLSMPVQILRFVNDNTVTVVTQAGLTFSTTVDKLFESVSELNGFKDDETVLIMAEYENKNTHEVVVAPTVRMIHGLFANGKALVTSGDYYMPRGSESWAAIETSYLRHEVQKLPNGMKAKDQVCVAENTTISPIDPKPVRANQKVKIENAFENGFAEVSMKHIILRQYFFIDSKKLKPCK